ncbi:MAG: hypothetical protein U0353_22990 [Sandaracinus sp.]
MGCAETHVTDDAARALDGGTSSAPDATVPGDAPSLDASPRADAPARDAATCVSCSGVCIDLLHDPRACTASNLCGAARRCGPRERCDEGVCTCADGTLFCEDGCHDTSLDPMNCGGCGRACGTDEVCADGVCVTRPGLTGGFGESWIAFDPAGDSPTDPSCIQEYVPQTESTLYVAQGATFVGWDLEARSWRTLAAPPAPCSGACSLAFHGGELFMVAADAMAVFAPATGEWHESRSSEPLEANGMTVSDAERLWSANRRELLRLTPTLSEVTRVPLPEPPADRLTYDERTRRVVFGGGWLELWSYGTERGEMRLETRSPVPVGTAFCSDHQGHVYLGATSEPHRMWQYDTTRSVWTQLPPLPIDTTATTNCGVWERGELYVVTEPGHVLRMLPLVRR